MPLDKVTLFKNTHECSLDELFSENGISMYISEFTDTECLDLTGKVGAGLIQFYFALEGEFTYSFGPHYSLNLKSGQYFFFYNPLREMQFNVRAVSAGKWVALYTTIDKLHGMFLEDAGGLPFLQGDQAQKNLYEENEFSPEVRWTLESLFSSQLSPAANRIYSRGKALEIIALHFSKRTDDAEACPFLRDEENRSKIKKAKNILMERVTSSPSIAELADEVGISEYKLKSGFKEVYGVTVGGFVLDHKMNTAKSMLDKGSLQVSEVAYALGYGNPSHFITAFKKKFQITPKKYLQQK